MHRPLLVLEPDSQPATPDSINTTDVIKLQDVIKPARRCSALG